MKTTYRVFRRGFNAANNPSGGARPEDCTRLVATIEAASPEDAVAAALSRGVTVYNGQTIWAESEPECEAREAALAAERYGQVRVDYWIGTRAASDWCASVEEIDACLERHANSYPPRLVAAYGDELDYEMACRVIGDAAIDQAAKQRAVAAILAELRK